MGTEIVKTTEANICINDLRTDKEDHTEHKVLKVLGPDREGPEPLDNHRVVIVEMKKPFYNEFERIERIQKMVKEIGNDQELGEAIRREFGS